MAPDDLTNATYPDTKEPINKQTLINYTLHLYSKRLFIKYILILALIQIYIHIGSLDNEHAVFQTVVSTDICIFIYFCHDVHVMILDFGDSTFKAFKGTSDMPLCKWRVT